MLRFLCYVLSVTSLCLSMFGRQYCEFDLSPHCEAWCRFRSDVFCCLAVTSLFTQELACIMRDSCFAKSAALLTNNLPASVKDIDIIIVWRHFYLDKNK